MSEVGTHITRVPVAVLTMEHDIAYSLEANENTVLSLSADSQLLARREVALRSVGYQVLSLISEAHARFEMEMGQCGVLLLCYTNSSVDP